MKDDKQIELEKQVEELELEEKTNLLRITSDIGWSMIILPILTKMVSGTGIWNKILELMNVRVTPHRCFGLSFLTVLGVRSAFRISVMKSLMPVNLN